MLCAHIEYNSDISAEDEIVENGARNKPSGRKNGSAIPFVLFQSKIAYI